MINSISAFSILGYDTMTSIVLVLSFSIFPLLIFSFYTSIKVNTTYQKYSKEESKRKINAYTAARMILDREGLTNVEIKECRGVLTDHYDPRSNTVYLSQSTISSTSIAAIGVAAHEVGHAIQYARNYLPVKLRTAIIPVVNFTSKLLFPFMILNIILSIMFPFSSTSNIFIMVMIVTYGASMLFSLATLPCELNASSRAKKILVQAGVLDQDEVRVVGKVLSAAAMTYVASFIMTFVQFLRLLLIYLANRRNN